MPTPDDAAVAPATGPGTDLAPRLPCFVVMPFGTKPFNDGSGRTFDFDKVYRVIIERAVREAGLEPRRADEEKSSSIIHIDMFKSLRDNPIVLADLSLENPNVYYELGVRHVMSSRGTVLMCREGSMLPFDVRLSRVIFYTYDGVSFDWEEVEHRVVPALRAALVEARTGRPDSPVHALLERVMPEPAAEGAEGGGADGPARRESLDPYQELVAAHWAARKTPLAELKRVHAASPFGCRALAYLCLRRRTLNAGEARALTKDLYDAEQYDLTIRLFRRLEKQGVAFKSWELLRYGSSLFEVEPTAEGARKALAYELRAWDEARASLAAEGPTARNVADAFHCRKKLSMLYLSLWTLNRSDDDLARAIAAGGEALDFGRKGGEQGVAIAQSHLADTHLRVMLMLRVQAADRNRPDVEGHGEAVLRSQLASAPTGVAQRMNASYLRWYKAIVLADRGDGPRSFDLALANAQDDASLRDMPGCHQIGGRQYTNLRRFIEQFAHTLRHVDLVARISQVLHRFQQTMY